MNIGTGSLSVLSFLCLKKTLFLFKNAVSNILFYVECQQEYCRRMFFDAKRYFYDIKFIGILTMFYTSNVLYKMMVCHPSITVGSPENNVFEYS